MKKSYDGGGGGGKASRNMFISPNLSAFPATQHNLKKHSHIKFHFFVQSSVKLAKQHFTLILKLYFCIMQVFQAVADDESGKSNNWSNKIEKRSCKPTSCCTFASTGHIVALLLGFQGIRYWESEPPPPGWRHFWMTPYQILFSVQVLEWSTSNFLLKFRTSLCGSSGHLWLYVQDFCLRVTPVPYTLSAVLCVLCVLCCIKKNDSKFFFF